MTAHQVERAQHRMRSADRAVYVMHVRPNEVWITAEDVEYPIDKFGLRSGESLRLALESRGWRIVASGYLPRGQLYVARR